MTLTPKSTGAPEIVHQVTYECEEPTPLTDTVLELAQAVLERDPR